MTTTSELRITGLCLAYVNGDQELLRRIRAEQEADRPVNEDVVDHNDNVPPGEEIR